MFDEVTNMNIDKLIVHINEQAEIINKLIDYVNKMNERVEALEKQSRQG